MKRGSQSDHVVSKISHMYSKVQYLQDFFCFNLDSPFFLCGLECISQQGFVLLRAEEARIAILFQQQDVDMLRGQVKRISSGTLHQHLC